MPFEKGNQQTKKGKINTCDVCVCVCVSVSRGLVISQANNSHTRNEKKEEQNRGGNEQEEARELFGRSLVRSRALSTTQKRSNLVLHKTLINTQTVFCASFGVREGVGKEGNETQEAGELFGAWSYIPLEGAVVLAGC